MKKKPRGGATNQVRRRDERSLILEKIRDVLNPESMVETVGDIVQMAVEHERVAFGNCQSCFGKGYATTMEFESWSTGRKMLSLVRYCRCDRGRQLKELAQAGAFLPTNRALKQ